MAGIAPMAATVPTEAIVPREGNAPVVGCPGGARDAWICRRRQERKAMDLRRALERCREKESRMGPRPGERRVGPLLRLFEPAERAQFARGEGNYPWQRFARLAKRLPPPERLVAQAAVPGNSLILQSRPPARYPRQNSGGGSAVSTTC